MREREREMVDGMVILFILSFLFCFGFGVTTITIVAGLSSELQAAPCVYRLSGSREIEVGGFSVFGHWFSNITIFSSPFLSLICSFELSDL